MGQKLFNSLPEHGHVVVLLLPWRVNQRDVPVSGISDQFLQQWRFAVELGSAPSLKLGPFFRVVSKRFAKFGARREVSRPSIEFGSRFSLKPLGQSRSTRTR